MIGIIGGTGLYQIEELTDAYEKEVLTPFGHPSASIRIGRIGNKEVAFLPRHGSAHALTPSEINYRANIYALKSVGVTQILSVSAVGSLSSEIAPGDLAIPSQYLDFTKGKRAHTFFGEGVVAHVSTAKPSCSTLTDQIVRAATDLDFPLHTQKTYVCVEGPRLGTQAESHFFRNQGCHVVGMSNVPEAFLAREAQICYCTIALSTDYDCWLDDPEQHATVDKVIALYKKNLNRVQAILKRLLLNAQSGELTSSCECRTSLKHALLTPDEMIPESKRAFVEILKL